MRLYKEIKFCKVCRNRYIVDQSGSKYGYCDVCQKKMQSHSQTEV